MEKLLEKYMQEYFDTLLRRRISEKNLSENEAHYWKGYLDSLCLCIVRITDEPVFKTVDKYQHLNMDRKS